MRSEVTPYSLCSNFATPQTLAIVQRVKICTTAFNDNQTSLNISPQKLYTPLIIKTQMYNFIIKLNFSIPTFKQQPSNTDSDGITPFSLLETHCYQPPPADQQLVTVRLITQKI
jgi:hypothetical protein